MRPSCFSLGTLCIAAALAGCRSTEPSVGRRIEVSDAPSAASPRPFPVRMAAEQLRNPFWYAEHGGAEEARQFWDTGYWEGLLARLADDGYNAVLFMPEPWSHHAWQTFLIRHEEFPEARDYTDEQYAKLIGHVRWIFRRSRELGLQNFLWSYFVVTTPAFARAHGMDREMPVSATVDYRHNLKNEMGWHFGVRNELTRAFTAAAVAEVHRTYPELDGLCGGMGEALPGKRSAWFREAILPGLERSGRNPVFIVDDWMLPLDGFLQDIAGAYPNTWLSIKANGEMFTDQKPYPDAVRWAEECGVPVLLQVMCLNLEANFPFDSPRLAHEVLAEFRKTPHCIGYVSWFLSSNPNRLFRRALGRYGKTAEPYSEGPWIELLVERFGDRRAAEGFLRALDAAARIPVEMAAIAWLPQDIGHSQQLMLPYWHWSLEDPRWGHFTSPSRGAGLLPLRHYAQVVARHGERFRDNSGSDREKNTDHPGAEELIWGLTRYPTTPEAHMRTVRRLGEECARHASEAARAAKRGLEEAARLEAYMEAYRLLTVYYERKVLSTIAALIHGFGGAARDREDAERLAGESLALYREAMDFLWERIDGKRGQIRARWGGKTFTLPELVENEARERGRLAQIFRWPPERTAGR